MIKPVAWVCCFTVFLSLQSCFPYKSSSSDSAETKAEASPGHYVKKTYYQNGALHKEMVYENGVQQGFAKEYYKSGKIFQEVMYEGNLREGVARRYFESGVISQETPYHKDKMHGVQKRYRRSGDLMCEIPYYEGNQCIGLKEYTTDGKLKKRYPSIKITPVDNILLNGTYTLRLQMSDNSKGVEYYVGKLSEGKYIGDEANQVWEIMNGVGEVNYPMPPGSFLMEEVNVIAKVKTAQSNYYITQSTFHLAIENR